MHKKLCWSQVTDLIHNVLHRILDRIMNESLCDEIDDLRAMQCVCQGNMYYIHVLSWNHSRSSQIL